MIIEASRCVIRPVRAADAEALYDIRQRVAPFQGRSDRTLEETRGMYSDMEKREPGSEPGWHQFVIEDENRHIVGDIGVNFDGPGPRQLEIGYSLYPDHWGRGIAADALSSLLQHLFDKYDVHRVVATTGADNERSRALLERLGFRREGAMIESWLEPGEQRWSDELLYAILDREWRRTNGSGGGT